MSPPAAALLAESDHGKGSPIGLFVVLLLVIAVFLLYRSMTGHLRRLPEKFPIAGDSADQAAPPDGSDTGSAGSGSGTAGTETAGSDPAGSGSASPAGPNGERSGPS